MNHLLNNKNSFFCKKYWLFYSISFAVLSVVVFASYFFAGKSFVYNGDALAQHFPAYVYYGRYLREILHGILFERQFVIPQWDFSIGEGSDIIQTLCYYCLGDPFAFFSFLVPDSCMHIYYTLMSLLRMYLAGVAFSYLCFYFGKTNKIAVFGGSMSYVFFHFAIYNAVRHVCFLNSMIYFPLMILGTEKILRDEKPNLFIGMVFISAVSNFYFFYMIVLLEVVYALVRLFALYGHSLKTILRFVTRFVLYAILGVFMGAVLVLPVLYTFLSDSRLGMAFDFKILNSLVYYLQYPSFFVTLKSSNWSAFTLAVPVVLAVYQIFRTFRKNKTLSVLLVLCLVFSLFPFFGQILNGFSYPSNRWGWAFALLLSYLLVCEWEHLSDIKWLHFAVFALVFLASSAFSEKTNLILCVIQMFLLFSLVFLQKKFSHSENVVAILVRPFLPIATVFLSIVAISAFLFSPIGENYSRTGLTKAQIDKELFESEELLDIEKEIRNDLTFVRYAARNDSNFNYNKNILSGIPSSQFYWTLSNPNVIRFRSEIEEKSGAFLHAWCDYDDRSALYALAGDGLLYVSTDNKNPLPFGFSATETKTVFKNEYALPFGYTYNSYMKKSEWSKLDSLQKQESLLSVAILDDDAVCPLPTEIPQFSEITVDFQIASSDGVIAEKNSFVVIKENATVSFDCDFPQKAESYLRVKNLRFSTIPKYDIYTKYQGKNIGGLKKLNLILKKYLSAYSPDITPIEVSTPSGTSKKLKYATPSYTWYADRHDFTVCLSYSEEKISKVSLSFSEPGIYTFDHLEFASLFPETYPEKINVLKKNALENLSLGINSLQGTTKTDENKILCIPLPYAKGWNAKIDGKKTKIFRTNGMYSGILLEAGEHTVELHYNTPFLRAGAIVSVISMLFFFAFVLSTTFLHLYFSKNQKNDKL